MVKKEWKPTYHTEWNIQQFLNNLIGVQLMEATRLNISLVSYNDNSMAEVNEFYAVLWNLWDDLRQYTKLKDHKDITKWFAHKFNEIEKERRETKVVTKKLIWDLSELYSQIKMIQQMTGLGLQLELNMTQLDKLKRAMGIKKDG